MWRSWRPRSVGAGTARPQVRRSRGRWRGCGGACSPPHGSTLDGSVGSGSPTHRSSVLVSLTGTGLPILLLGAVAVTIVGTIPAPTAEALWRVSSNELVNLQARWDTDFYHQIATAGYRWDRSAFLHQNVVFFPLYPLLMRWGGTLLGGHPLLAGTVISLAAFAGAMSLLYRIAVLELGEEKAWPVILLVSTYPFALFYSVVYTESLFLFLTVGAFYAMRRRYLLPAALAGLAAGGAPPHPVLLALPLSWEAPPVAAHLFISLGRFTSVLFPLFLWLALIVPRPRVARVAGAFAAAQAALAVCFYLWRPVV